MDTITAPCHPLLTRSQPDAHISVGDKPDVTADLRNLSQPLSELVHRCGDHDRAVVDMQCTLSNALNEINKLKHTNANSGSSLSPDTTTCSDKSSVLLVLDDDYPCPAQPPRDPGHHDGSPLEDSNNISVILSNTDNGSPSQSVPVRSADAPAPTGIQLLTPDCSFNQTNKSLSSLLQGTPHGSHSTQVNEGTDPSRAHDKSNNTCSLSHCELQSKVDQLILELRSISDNHAKLENRVHALEAQVNDDSHFRPIFDEVTSNRQCMDEIRHTVNELKEHVGCQKTVEPASDSTNGHTNPAKEIVTVPCSNRFAVLQDHSPDDVDVVHYKGAQSGMSSAVPAAAQCSQSPEPMADTRAKRTRGQRGVLKCLSWGRHWFVALAIEYMTVTLTRVVTHSRGVRLRALPRYPKWHVKTMMSFWLPPARITSHGATSLPSFAGQEKWLMTYTKCDRTQDF